MSHTPRIIIVGAGVAGIAAATKLIENGFTEIIVLEAETRIGGRVNSVDFGENIVDLGGQWVHGEKGNVVYEMVKDLNLLCTSKNNYEDNTYYLSNGTVVDKHLTDNFYKICMDIWTDEESAKKHCGTFGEYFNIAYNERVLKTFKDQTDTLLVAKYLQDWFHKFFLCLDSAASWHDVSTSGAFRYQSCEGNQQLNWRDKGYNTILDVMMKRLPDETRQLEINHNIFLNKQVNKVVWGDSRVNVDRGVTVCCADGSSYIADHVIITVSVGVLKKFHKDLFVPDLPAYKVKTIEHFSFGTVNKIFLKFPIKWWPDDLKGFSLLWTDNDRKKLLKDYPYGPSIDGKSWLEDIYGFYVIDSHPKVLLGWIVGEMARQVELLPDEIVLNGCMHLLRQFVGNKYKVEDVDGILRSKWSSNSHFCGSYAHVGIEHEKNNVSADDLSKPIVANNSKQTLLFAGEATHPKYFSTVHGAIETGYREAERIINIYKEQNLIFHKVIVVGAGMAGLGAARKLQELNCTDYIILEAQEQPGGRIQTIQVNNKPLDLGAQWLHGKLNPLYEIAQKNNLLSPKMSLEGEGKYIRNDGVVFDKFLVKTVDFQIGKILEKCSEFVEQEEYPSSVGDFIREEFLLYLNQCNDPEHVKLMKLELLDWHIRFQVIDNSCQNLNRLSAKNWGKYVCIDDIAHYNLKYGFKALVDILVEDLPENKILLNTAVTKIEYATKTKGQIILTCSDRTQFICDHLLLTPSLGYLKNFTDIFPQLPVSLSDSINAIGFYGIGKIFLLFDFKWWNDEPGFQFIWKTDTIMSNKEKWVRCITGFDEVFNQPNALLGWVGGEAVEEMESLSEEDVAQACTNLLRTFLPDYNIPLPTRVFRTKWFSNHWVKGSYCHITPECDNSGCGINKLAEPVFVDGVPRILLAGEAVHSSHYSTAHGAYESGQQQAGVLYEYLKSSNLRSQCKKCT